MLLFLANVSSWENYSPFLLSHSMVLFALIVPVTVLEYCFVVFLFLSLLCHSFSHAASPSLRNANTCFVSLVLLQLPLLLYVILSLPTFNPLLPLYLSITFHFLLAVYSSNCLPPSRPPIFLHFPSLSCTFCFPLTSLALPSPGLSSPFPLSRLPSKCILLVYSRLIYSSRAPAEGRGNRERT